MSIATQNRHLHLRGATGRPRREMYQGREHVVVPVIALLEGVIHAINAETPEFVPYKTLAHQPERWDGAPVVLNHPAKNGVQISAKEPGVFDAQGLGTIFKACVRNKKLALEAWIDVEKATKVAPRLLERVDNGEPIEVSVGAYVTTLKNAGVFNGRNYKAEWQSITPDHLAFLPEGIGACSIQMGCGAHRAATAHLVTAEGIEALSKKQYTKIQNEAASCGCQGDHNMKTKAERIAALQANKHNTVTDIKVLEAACENTLTALEAAAAANEKAAQTEADLKAAQDKVNEAEAKLKAASERKLTSEEIMAASPEIASIVTAHNLRVAAEHATLVASLKTAAAGAYTEDELKAMSVEQLTKLAALAKVETAPQTYVGVGVPRAAGANNDAQSFTPPDPYAAGLKTLQGV